MPTKQVTLNKTTSTPVIGIDSIDINKGVITVSRANAPENTSIVVWECTHEFTYKLVNIDAPHSDGSLLLGVYLISGLKDLLEKDLNFQIYYHDTMAEAVAFHAAQ